MLKQFLCNHDFKLIDNFPFQFIWEDESTTNVDVGLLECIKCGKRHVVSYDKYYYRKNVWEMLKLWEKGKISTEELNKYYEELSA